MRERLNITLAPDALEKLTEMAATDTRAVSRMVEWLIRREWERRIAAASVEQCLVDSREVYEAGEADDAPTPEFMEGYNAYLTCEDRVPYSMGTRQWREWTEGYMTAYDNAPIGEAGDAH